jgi:hypothetical protein
MTTKTVRVIKYEGAGAFTPTPDIWGEPMTRRLLWPSLRGVAGPHGGGFGRSWGGDRPLAGSAHRNRIGGALLRCPYTAVGALDAFGAWDASRALGGQNAARRPEERAIVTRERFGTSLPALRACHGDRVVVVLVVHIDPDEDPCAVPVAVPVTVPVVRVVTGAVVVTVPAPQLVRVGVRG